MTSVQLEVPDDIYRRLINHPDCPNWRGRRKWILNQLIDQMNSPAFKVKELEHQNARLRRERDQKAKDADFWRTRAGGFQSPFAQKPNPTQQNPAQQGKTNAA